MLIKVKRLNYDAEYSFAPPEEEALVETAQIVSVHSTVTRRREPCVMLSLVNGQCWTCIGTPDDIYRLATLTTPSGETEDLPGPEIELEEQLSCRDGGSVTYIDSVTGTKYWRDFRLGSTLKHGILYEGEYADTSKLAKGGFRIPGHFPGDFERLVQ